MDQITRTFSIQRRGKNDDRRLLATINTKSMDRYDTVILPEGVDLTNYRNNPVVLFNHKPDEVIGKSRVNFRNGELQAEMDDEDWAGTDEAKKVRSLVSGGFINAVSIRFLPLKAVEKLIDPAGDANDWRNRYTEYQEWELLEWSFVTIPGNTDALITQRSLTDSQLETLKSDIQEIKARLLELAPSRSDTPDDAADKSDDSDEAPAPEAEPESEAAAETDRKILGTFLDKIEESMRQQRQRELGRA